MEPISALGLAATCTSLLSSIVKITSALHEFREKFKSAELAILSLGTQLATLQASISELTIILSSQVSTINQRTRLLETLHDALSSTSLVISYISDEFTETTKFTTEPSTVFRADRWVRAKFVFSESGLAPMKEALRDQIQAIHLLLSIATMYVTRQLQTGQYCSPDADKESSDPPKMTKPSYSATRRASVPWQARGTTAHLLFSGTVIQIPEHLSIVTSLTPCPVSA